MQPVGKPNSAKREPRAVSALELPYRSADGMIDLQGRDWFREPRGWWDVVRCRLGLHRPVTFGYMRLRYIERCSCGAHGGGRGHWLGRWMCLDPQVGRRRPT